MSATLTILIISFIFFMLIGLPIGFGIGLSSILALLTKSTIPLLVVPQRLFTAIDSFPLLAVPLFIFAGDIMMYGGISQRLVNLAKKTIGWSISGLAYVTIVASAFFGAISGSAAATTAAIGGMMYPEMVNANYRKPFASFLGAIAGTLGILIPPSIALIIYGTQTNTSVGDLFLGGAVVGVIATIIYCLTAKITLSLDKEVKVKAEPLPSWKEFGKAFAEAFWGLLSPIIILGGIYSGVFTATEAAVVAVIYSLFVGFFIYRELTIKRLIDCFVGSALTSSMVLLLVAVASLFSWILTIEGVANIMGGLVVQYGLTTVAFFIVVNILYLIMGMFIETIPIIILCTPIFFPVAQTLGIDPVHFGVITVFNLAYGMVTPPFGLDLFVANGYSKQQIAPMVSCGKWFYLAGFSMIFIFSFFPQLINWIW